MTATEIGALLPAVFRQALPEDATMQSLLDVMAGMLDPVERRLETLSEIFDALCCDDDFVAMLAGWVDLSWLNGDDASEVVAPLDWPDSTVLSGRLRMLIEASHTLSQERGTAAGLVRFLETATGVAGFAVGDAVLGAPPFHLQVRVPRDAAAQMNLIARIVDAEKPAYATWEAIVTGS